MQCKSLKTARTQENRLKKIVAVNPLWVKWMRCGICNIVQVSQQFWHFVAANNYCLLFQQMKFHIIVNKRMTRWLFRNTKQSTCIAFASTFGICFKYFGFLRTGSASLIFVIWWFRLRWFPKSMVSWPTWNWKPIY